MKFWLILSAGATILKRQQQPNQRRPPIPQQLPPVNQPIKQPPPPVAIVPPPVIVQSTGLTRVPATNPNIVVPPPGQFCSKLSRKLGPISRANGTQPKLGGITCSSNTLGVLQQPNFQISTILIFPQDGSTISKSAEIQIKANAFNLDGGFFSDPNSQYYLSPQTLGNNKVEGHVHVTVQQLLQNEVPDPQQFQFFKGVDAQSVDPAQREFVAVMPANTLSVPGLYRICTLAGSFTHQPIVSSVQRRGSPDDCIRVNVV